MSGRQIRMVAQLMDGAIPTRDFSCTLLVLVPLLTSYASWSLFWAFFSTRRRIRDLRPANDSARRAGHDGTIWVLN